MSTPGRRMFIQNIAFAFKGHVGAMWGIGCRWILRGARFSGITIVSLLNQKLADILSRAEGRTGKFMFYKRMIVPFRDHDVSTS